MPSLAGIAAAAGASLIVGPPAGNARNHAAEPAFRRCARRGGDGTRRLAGYVARAAGIPDERLAVDPGIGFGKRLEDNLALLANAGGLGATIGAACSGGAVPEAHFSAALTGDPVECRDAATAAGVCSGYLCGS